MKAIPKNTISGNDQNTEKGSDGGDDHDNITTETSRMPFLMLGLDLPPPPLFKDVMEKNIIPQVLDTLKFLILELTESFCFFIYRLCLRISLDKIYFYRHNINLYGELLYENDL